MILEQEIQPYSLWFPAALRHFGAAAFFVILAAAVIGFLIAAFRYGPLPAGDLMYRTVVGAVLDLVQMSLRRVWALSRLAIQESMRRRVWVALVAFGVILMFAGWFLDPRTPAPGPLYLTFVMSWTTYLIVLLALFISAFSLPADIKNRTIHTVVTKPVRSCEIVLGRIIGFTLVGTALLAIMAVCSYIFVLRSLSHIHEIRPEDVNEARITSAEIKQGRVGTTRTAQNHEHDIFLKDDGTLETDFKHGHKHRVTTSRDADGTMHYTCGGPEDMFIARVPVLGDLRFLDRDGQPSPKGARQGRTALGGINVGKEWDYRGFIEGGSLGAAIWTFDNIDEDRLFPNELPEKRKLPLEMTIRVFRTYKGNIEKLITGSLVLRNPETKMESAPVFFSIKDGTIDQQGIKRKLDKNGAAEGADKIDLFNDLVHNGRIEVVLQCLEPGQYLGMAPADLYIRAGDASFLWNFIKAYLGIWFQMVLVIGLGVMFSTFLSGAVAMLATLGSLVMGYFTGFVDDLFKGVIENNRKLMPGGGPIEAFIRLVTQKTITVPYEESMGINVVYFVDRILMYIIDAWTSLLPDFGSFSNVNFVASGFNVPGDLVLEQATKTAAYLLGAVLAGFMFLRMREVAR
jgi:hypothetical protein